nr:hypothetical protein CFP56_46841 [Quercus suber]POE87640.1 hypothetical protein CFP56_30229 [Quercus suber]
MSQEVAIIAIVPVKADKRDRFIELTVEAMDWIRKNEPETLQFEFFEERTQEGVKFSFFERYASQEAKQRHENSDNYKKLFEVIGEESLIGEGSQMTTASYISAVRRFTNRFVLSRHGRSTAFSAEVINLGITTHVISIVAAAGAGRMWRWCIRCDSGGESISDRLSPSQCDPQWSKAAVCRAHNRHQYGDLWWTSTCAVHASSTAITSHSRPSLLSVRLLLTCIVVTLSSSTSLARLLTRREPLCVNWSQYNCACGGPCFVFDKIYGYTLAESTKSLSLQTHNPYVPVDTLWLGSSLLSKGFSVCDHTSRIPVARSPFNQAGKLGVAKLLHGPIIDSTTHNKELHERHLFLSAVTQSLGSLGIRVVVTQPMAVQVDFLLAFEEEGLFATLAKLNYAIPATERMAPKLIVCNVYASALIAQARQAADSALSGSNIPYIPQPCGPRKRRAVSFDSSLPDIPRSTSQRPPHGERDLNSRRSIEPQALQDYSHKQSQLTPLDAHDAATTTSFGQGALGSFHSLPSFVNVQDETATLTPGVKSSNSEQLDLMLVYDNPINIQLLATYCKKRVHRSRVATDGLQAVNMYRHAVLETRAQDQLY